MGEKIGNIIREIGKIFLVLSIAYLPWVGVDIFYRIGYQYWSSWNIVFLLKHCNITYSSAYRILGGNFGVIITMFSMFLSMSNNISERFEKKVFGIQREDLFSEDKWCYRFFYRYLNRMCLCAPVLMLLFLNFECCVSGYAVFWYCIIFLWWHYYKYVSSYSRNQVLSKAVIKLEKDLPKDSLWTEDTLVEYQITLENIGRSVEEDGNWKEIEKLYNGLLLSTEKYHYEKRYLIAYHFYQTVFWRREKRSRFMPMSILKTFIDGLDNDCGESGLIAENKWPVLWGMMRVAVREADEDELIRFLQYFYDYPVRSRRVLQKTGTSSAALKVLEEEAGMILILLEYRFRQTPPENVRFIDLLPIAWECGRRSLTVDGYECVSKVFLFIQVGFEEDRSVLETVMDTLRSDCSSDSRKSLIANIITMEKNNKNG